ncbi:MAG: hypothetical protein RL070_2073 [Bacteroidota bacterium]
MEDYTPRIEEYINQHLQKSICIPADRVLYFKLFITNPMGLDYLKCFLKIEELNAEREIISEYTQVYSVEKGYENWKWVSFEY